MYQSVIKSDCLTFHLAKMAADDSFKSISINETFLISIRISLKFVPNGPLDNGVASA